MSLESWWGRVSADLSAEASAARTNWWGSFAKEEGTLHSSLWRSAGKSNFPSGYALVRHAFRLCELPHYRSMQRMLRTSRHSGVASDPPIRNGQHCFAPILHDSRLTDPAFAGSVFALRSRPAVPPSRRPAVHAVHAAYAPSYRKYPSHSSCATNSSSTI